MPEHLPWTVRLTELEVQELGNLFQWATERMNAVEANPDYCPAERREFAHFIRGLEQRWFYVRFVNHWAVDKGMSPEDADLVVNMASRGHTFNLYVHQGTLDAGAYVELV